MAENILEVKNMVKHFATRKHVVRAVDGVSLTLDKGETLGIVGESGSGKSTIAYNVIGMYKPTSGELLFKGEKLHPDIRKRSISQKGDMQIVFQDPGSSLNPRHTIEKNLSPVIKLHGGVEGSQKIRERAEELLLKVGLPADYADKYPRSIGGGERQLVCIARALACNPSMIILDEPTSALDVSIQAKVIRHLIELQREMGLSYLFITHDLSLMRNLADRIAIMYLGKICETTGTVDFFRKPMHPYTQMLLSSIPVVTEEEKALKPKKVKSLGEIPNPANMPTGCGFHTRCPYCVERCVTEDPVMREITDGHYVRCHRVDENGEIDMKY